MYMPLDKSRPCPFPLKPTQVYLGEDASGYYVMEGFIDNIGNMFKRMVKFTPKSFTPGNIWKGIRNTTLTTMTGGIYLALPKNLKKTIEKVSDVAIPTVAGAVLAYTAGPAVMSALAPKLSTVAGFLGKSASSVGQGLFGILGKLSPSGQSKVAGMVTPQDLLYSEQNQGQFPPQFMRYVDEVARQDYAPTLQASVDPKQFYANSDLYPGLMEAQQAQQAQQNMQLEPPQEGWSSMQVAGAVGGAVLLAVLIGKKR